MNKHEYAVMRNLMWLLQDYMAAVTVVEEDHQAPPKNVNEVLRLAEQLIEKHEQKHTK